MTETLPRAETTEEQIEHFARALGKRPAEVRNKLWAAIAATADPESCVDPEDLYEAFVDRLYTNAVGEEEAA